LEAHVIMDKSKIFSKVSAIIVAEFGIKEDKVFLNTNLEKLGLDSLDLILLITKIEEEFQIGLNDRKVQENYEIQHIVNLIEKELPK